MKRAVLWWFMLIFLFAALQPVTGLSEEKSSGHVYLGDEILVFIPCGSDNAFLLMGPERVLHSLQGQWRTLNEQQPAPPHPLYVDLTGHFEENPDVEGRSADFDGLYRIESVLLSQAESPATCPVLVAED